MTAVISYIMRDRSAARDVVYNIRDNNIIIIYDIVMHDRYIQYRSICEIGVQFRAGPPGAYLQIYCARLVENRDRETIS